MPPSWPRVIQVQAWAIVALIVCVCGLSIAVVVIQTRHVAMMGALSGLDYDIRLKSFVDSVVYARTQEEKQRANDALRAFKKEFPNADVYRDYLSKQRIR